MDAARQKNRTDQLSLPFGWCREALERYLRETTGMNVSLHLTENTTSILSVKERAGVVLVRLQRVFVQAEKDVLLEISDFIRKRKGRMPRFRNFLKGQSQWRNGSRSRNLSLRSKGRFYDLEGICQELNEVYFNGRLRCRITWGLKSSRRAVRRRTLGSYDSLSGIIRINPVLDRRSVPKYFISFIVFHEMLHADMGFKEKNGRRSMHSREFREREKAFMEYKRATLWEKKHMA